MKDFFIDSHGKVRCTIGSSNTINSNYYQYENVSRSNDLGNFKKNVTSVYKKEIDNNYKHIGSRIYQSSCPVCSFNVYFCNCSNGGKVFFDSLAPEWEKHPCTNNTINNHSSEYYIFVYFTSFFKGSFIFNKHINDIKKFKIPSRNNKTFIKNIVNNVIILIRAKKDLHILTLIISYGKYKNHILVKDKFFKVFEHLLSFIIYVLSQKDLSTNINIDITNIEFPLLEKKEFTKVIFTHKKRFNLKNKKVTIKKRSMS